VTAPFHIAEQNRATIIVPVIKRGMTSRKYSAFETGLVPECRARRKDVDNQCRCEFQEFHFPLFVFLALHSKYTGGAVRLCRAL